MQTTMTEEKKADLSTWKACNPHFFGERFADVHFGISDGGRLPEITIPNATVKLMYKRTNYLDAFRVQWDDIETIAIQTRINELASCSAKAYLYSNVDEKTYYMMVDSRPFEKDDKEYTGLVTIGFPEVIGTNSRLDVTCIIVRFKQN